MAKLSFGDLSLNSQVSTSKPNVGEMLKKIEKSYPKEGNIKNDTSINNAIPINKNKDGSVKYTFDNI